jgi:hypothetical protein
MSVIIDYTNWRGERAMRRVQPISFEFASNRWHVEKQWLMTAIDLGIFTTAKKASR